MRIIFGEVQNQYDEQQAREPESDSRSETADCQSSVQNPAILLPGLSVLMKANVYLKLECYQPIRVFKIRGAANKILKLTPEERNRGLVAASSGNHGVAVAYLAKLTGTQATIVVPTTAVDEKLSGDRGVWRESH